MEETTPTTTPKKKKESVLSEESFLDMSEGERNMATTRILKKQREQESSRSLHDKNMRLQNRLRKMQAQLEAQQATK